MAVLVVLFLYMHVKKFPEWIGLKEKLHSIIHQAPHVSEGEVWWISIGENIGTEISGKSQLFSRPVIIFRKLSHSFYFVIPITSKLRMGSWYVNIKQQNRNMSACLHQGRAIDYRRLSNRLGELNGPDFEKVKIGFKKLYT